LNHNDCGAMCVQLMWFRDKCEVPNMRSLLTCGQKLHPEAPHEGNDVKMQQTQIFT
jgi:hypothetical protein